MTARKPNDADRKQREEWAAAAMGYPCARCGVRAALVYSYRPENPKDFELKPGYGLYIPLCLDCYNGGDFDLEFLESQLKHCGVAVNERQQ